MPCKYMGLALLNLAFYMYALGLGVVFVCSACFSWIRGGHRVRISGDYCKRNFILKKGGNTPIL